MKHVFYMLNKFAAVGLISVFSVWMSACSQQQVLTSSNAGDQSASQSSSANGTTVAGKETDVSETMPISDEMTHSDPNQSTAPSSPPPDLSSMLNPDECTEHTGYVPIHRLNEIEYTNTLRDLLGITSDPGKDLPSELDPYDNSAEALLYMPQQTVERFVDLSESVVDESFSTNRDKVVSCDPNQDGENQCLRESLTRFVEQAYRRPATVSEVDELVALAHTEETVFDDGIKLAIRAVIVSPSFLYRSVPVDSETSTTNDPTAIDSYALATRISYFIWGTTPDQALLASAKNGTLSDISELRRQVDRLTSDERFYDFMTELIVQWYEIYKLDDHVTDASIFSQDLQDDMMTETRMFIKNMLSENLSSNVLLNADYTFLNQRLAAHYGIPGVEGMEFRRVPLDGYVRKGLITHGSILTMNSDIHITSIVGRGMWLLDRVFCETTPPEPDNIPDEVIPENFSGTRRDLFEQHRKNEPCKTCHEVIDPLGFGMENYDALGKYREEDNGNAVDSSGETPSGKSFSNAADLLRIIGSDTQTKQCLSNHFLRYALGRPTKSEDKCTIARITQNSIREDSSFSDFIFEIVSSDAFLKRPLEGETK